MRRMLVSAFALAALAAVAAVPEQAAASPFVRYGIQDDAWLEYGPGALDARVTTSMRPGTSGRPSGS